MINYLKKIFVRNKATPKTIKEYLETVEVHLDYAYIITDSMKVFNENIYQFIVTFKRTRELTNKKLEYIISKSLLVPINKWVVDDTGMIFIDSDDVAVEFINVLINIYDEVIRIKRMKNPSNEDINREINLNLILINTLLILDEIEKRKESF